MATADVRAALEYAAERIRAKLAELEILHRDTLRKLADPAQVETALVNPVVSAG